MKKNILQHIIRVKFFAEHDPVLRKNRKNRARPTTGVKGGKMLKKLISFFISTLIRKLKIAKKNIVDMIFDVKSIAENDPGGKIN